MAITKRDEIEQFKRELKSLNYYKKKRDEIKDKLIIIGRVLYEPKANSYNNVGGKGDYNYLDLLQKEDYLKQMYGLYDQLIRHIGYRLDCIDESDDRQLLMDIYIRKFSFEKMATNHHMSIRNLKYHVDLIIKNIV